MASVLFAAPTQSTLRSVTVLVDGNVIYLDAARPGDGHVVNVTAVLADGSGAPKGWSAATLSEAGHAELTFETGGTARWRPIHILPGDAVSLAVAGSDPFELAIPLLSAATDGSPVVVGTAPSGALVTVTATNADDHDSQVVTADSDGRWAAEFATAGMAFGLGTRGAAYVQDGSVTYQTLWAVKGARLEVGANPIRVFAPAGTEVAVEAVEGPDALAGQAVVAPADNQEGAAVWLADPTGDGVPLAASARLALTIGATTTPVCVPPLALRLDPAADWITGTAEPGAPVIVTYGDATVQAAADSDGSWLADFAGIADVRAGYPASVASDGRCAGDSNGLVLEVSRTAWVPQVVEYDPFVPEVDIVGQAGDLATLRITDADFFTSLAGTEAIGPDGTLRMLARDAGGSVRVWRRGDTAEVTSNGEAFHFAPWVTTPWDANGAVQASAGDDTVFGVVDPAAQVWVHALGADRYAEVDAAGNFRVDFSGAADLAPGVPVMVSVTGPEDVTTELEFPVWRANAQARSNRVVIEGPPGLVASLELEREGSLIATGGCTVGDTPRPCEARLVDSSLGPVLTTPGDALLVYAGGATEILELVDVTAHIDLAGRDVVGVAPTGSPVTIEFTGRENRSAPPSVTTSPDAAGVFDHELTASQWALLSPGLVAEAHHTLSNGHRVFARGVVELVIVQEGLPIRGLVEPLAPLTITWGAGGNVAYARADALGFFYEYAVVPAMGDVVSVAHRRGRHTAQLAPLFAWSLGRDLALSGSAPPNTGLVATFVTGWDPRFTEAASTTVVARSAAGGTFFADSPMVNRVFPELRASLPGKVELVAYVDLDRPLIRVYVPSAATTGR